MTKKPKHPGGRPTKYKPEFIEQAGKLCNLGATDVELFDFFQINIAALNRWKIEYPEFCATIKEGKDASLLTFIVLAVFMARACARVQDGLLARSRVAACVVCAAAALSPGSSPSRQAMVTKFLGSAGGV
jgi:hypothetical protein